MNQDAMGEACTRARSYEHDHRADRLDDLLEAVPTARLALETLLEAERLGQFWAKSCVQNVLGGRTRVQAALDRLIPEEERRSRYELGRGR